MKFRRGGEKTKHLHKCIKLFIIMTFVFLNCVWKFVNNVLTEIRKMFLYKLFEDIMS